ncbi:hypothetical protein KCU78_g2165, partial [Aureobasidium melanogenum]
MWSSLQRLEITFSAAAADGGWLLERDPDPNNYREGGSDDEEDPDLVRQRRKLSRRHRLQEAEARTTDFDQEFESDWEDNDLDFEVCYSDYFRIWPSQKLERIFVNLARAAAQMPALRMLTAGLVDMPYIAMHQRLQLFYLASGETHADCLWDFTNDSEHRHQRRLYWRVPRSWRMNEELEQAWRVVLGEHGIVDYFDCTDERMYVPGANLGYYDRAVRVPVDDHDLLVALRLEHESTLELPLVNARTSAQVQARVLGQGRGLLEAKHHLPGVARNGVPDRAPRCARQHGVALIRPHAPNYPRVQVHVPGVVL